MSDVEQGAEQLATLRPLTNREYRDLRGSGNLICLKCGKKPTATWSWDNDPPYSQCCQAPVALNQEGKTND